MRRCRAGTLFRIVTRVGEESMRNWGGGGWSGGCGVRGCCWQWPFTLQPIELAWNRGYNRRELNHILALTREHHARLTEMWHGHCD